jgi:uncharacterized protein
MSFEVARKIVDYAYDNIPPEQNLEFSFFGGEPLFCFDLIVKIVDYIKLKNILEARMITFSITSNGTLITDEILDYFSLEGINLCISIDGPEHIHNINRKLPDGQGSFNLIIENLRRAQKKLISLQVNAVYSQNTIDYLLEIVIFFRSLGISSIHLNPNITETWDRNRNPEFKLIFRQVADAYIDSYENLHELAINCLDSKIILFLQGGYKAMNKCGMGETELGFAVSGNIYPCERFIGDDNDYKHCIGHIDKGIDPGLRCKVIKHRGNRNEECQKCNLQKYCMNWCGCTNYYLTNHTDIVGPVVCELEKAIIYAAKHAFIVLQNNDLFLSHFYKYVQEGYHYQQ